MQPTRKEWEEHLSKLWEDGLKEQALQREEQKKAQGIQTSQPVQKIQSSSRRETEISPTVQNSSVQRTGQTQTDENPSPSQSSPTSKVSNLNDAEPFHLKEALLTGACFIAGLIFLLWIPENVNDPQTVPTVAFVGLLMVAASVVGTIVTSFWTKFNALSSGAKLIAYAPVIVGGIAAFAVVIVGYILIGVVTEGTKAHIADIERQNRDARPYSSTDKRLEDIAKNIEKYRD